MSSLRKAHFYRRVPKELTEGNALGGVVSLVGILCSAFLVYSNAASYFTTAVRTGGEGSGMMGVSLLLIEKARKGVSVRPMDCMGAKGSGTSNCRIAMGSPLMSTVGPYLGGVTLVTFTPGTRSRSRSMRMTSPGAVPVE